jgi:hypothetical protein
MKRFVVRLSGICLAVLLTSSLYGQLPTSLGWSPLGTQTSLSGSGACPANGFGGDPYSFANNCRNVIRAWSGAVADTSNNRLLLFGGGGSNYYGNEIYSLNLTANPVTLTRVKDPTIPSNYATRTTCNESLGGTDFAPNSRTSYDGMAYLTGAQRLYVYGGVLACNASSGTRNTWTIDASALSNSSLWQHMDPTVAGTVPGGNGGGTTGVNADYDPNTAKAIVADGGALFTYDYPTNTYRQITANYGFVKSYYVTGVVDPVHKLFIAMGNCPGGVCASGNGVLVADISNALTGTTTQQNWTTNTLADANCKEFLSGGASPITNGAATPGLVFDTVGGTLVGWPSSGNSVYLITPDAVNQRMTCQKVTYANGPPNATQTAGTFGRFRYFPALDVFVVINDFNIPAYIFRLRSTTPTATVNPSSLTFASQVVNTTSAAQAVTITNSGGVALVISGISASGDYSQTNTCGTLPATLATGASCSVSVSFTPTVVGTRSGAATINDNTAAGVETVTLTGTGTSALAPAATLNPTSLAFGNQLINTSSTAQTITITSSGTASLVINAISVSGDYSQTNTCGALPVSLAPTASCVVSVTFKPTATGSRPGTLTITDNTSAGNATAPLSGTGTAPAATLNPTSLAFGNQLINTSSTAQTITITSSGAVSLIISSITISGDYSQTNTCGALPATLAPTASCVVSVTFKPTATGSRPGTLTITDNASAGNATAPLTGSGTAPAATLAPTSLTFPNQAVSTTSTAQTITVTSSGTASLVVSAIAISGDYRQTNTCGTLPATLAPATSCVVSVTFAPTVAGTRTGTLTISDNTAAGTETALLTGTGVVPTLTSITVTPANPALTLNATQQFTATGTYSDNSTQNLTSSVTWSSGNTAVATIGSTGLAVTVAQGTSTITATLSSISGSTLLTATASSLPQGLGWFALPAATAQSASGACPANGFGGDPYTFANTCRNVIRAWSGAIADTSNNRLLLFGGGGSNYYGNEIYSLNLMASPVTLTRIKDPTIPSNYATRTTCNESLGGTDFAPNSRTSYDGMAYLTGAKRMFISGGVLACNASSGTRNTWTIDTSTLSNATNWQHMDPTLTGTAPGSNGGGVIGEIADYDPNSAKAIVADGGALFTYDYPTNAYRQITANFGFVKSNYVAGVVDPVHKLFIAMGNCPSGTCASGNGVLVADISNALNGTTTQQNWTTATLADPNCAEFLSGGATPITNGAASPGLVFDTIGQTLVGWPSSGNSVYLITPDVVNQRMTCQKVTYANGPPNATQTTGTFGRFRYFPGLDVFVVINDFNIPAYIFRLRSTTPAATVSPSSLTFAAQVVNTTSAAQAVTITSNGGAALVINSISTAGDYSQTNTCGTLPATLAPGASCTVSVKFTPTLVGTRSGAVTINDNTVAGVETVTLTGTGAAALVPAATLNPTTLAFGNQQINTSSTAQTITITSSGTASLVINSIAVSGDYSQTNTCGTLPLSLAPATSCAVSVTFKPTATGSRPGTLIITDNTTAGTETAPLTGTGTAPAATLNPTSLTFSSQALGTTSSPQTITITSSGTASLVISAIGVSGDYKQSNTCGTLPKTLAPLATCAVAVNFAPTANGTRTGTLTINDNTAIGVESASLTGTGVTVTLTSIAVTPVNPSVTANSTQQFIATGTYSDGSNADVTATSTWASTNTSAATISATGLATGVAGGTTTISATIGSVSGSTLLTVTTSGLPTGVGWHSLGAQTAMSASGACPADGFGGDPYAFADNCRYVIRAWNGALADTNANRMLIWGGGHANYYGNEVYSLNLTANPVTFTRLKDPTVPTNVINGANCVESIPPGSTDFAPNSRESYGGLTFIPGADVMYSVGGSVACVNGFGTWNTWTIPLANLSNATQWQHMDPTVTGAVPNPNNGGRNLGMVADYDPNSGLVIVFDSGALYGYNYQTNNYVRITPAYGFLTNNYVFGLVDPSRKVFLAIGGLCTGGTCPVGSGVFVADISNPSAGTATMQNWTTATLADPICSEFLMGGATPIQGGAEYPGLVFDPVTNTIVGWPNAGNSVYIMTPDKVNMKLTCQKVTYAGGPPNSAQSFLGANSTNGTYNRFRYFPAFDAFVLVNDWNIPAYLLRLR